MSSADHNKPTGKPAQRSRKAKQASRKPDQRQRPKPDRQPDRQQHEKELIEATVASTETFPMEADAATGTSSIGTSSIGTAVALTETPSKGALVPI